jgi:hypothetical protein
MMLDQCIYNIHKASIILKFQVVNKLKCTVKTVIRHSLTLKKGDKPGNSLLGSIAKTASVQYIVFDPDDKQRELF